MQAGAIKSRTVKTCGLSWEGVGIRVVRMATSHWYGSCPSLALHSFMSNRGGPRNVVSPPGGVVDFGSPGFISKLKSVA